MVNPGPDDALHVQGFAEVLEILCFWRRADTSSCDLRKMHNLRQLTKHPDIATARIVSIHVQVNKTYRELRDL